MLKLKDEWDDAGLSHLPQTSESACMPGMYPGAGCVDILLVQRNLTQAEQAKYLLELHGYHVDLVLSGAETLRYLETCQPAIVICDVVLADTDGYALCHRIKTGERSADVCVLLIAETIPDDIIAGLNCGAESFLCRPYDDDLLLDRLKEILENREIRKQRGLGNGMEVFFAGRKRALAPERMQPVELLLATYETAVQKTRELDESHAELRHMYEATLLLTATLHTVLERSTDATLIVGLDGGIRYVNPAAAALFNRRSREMVDTRFSYPLAPDSTYEVTVMGIDGLERLLEVRVTVTYWEREEACLVSMRDVSDRLLPPPGAAAAASALLGSLSPIGKQ